MAVLVQAIINWYHTSNQPGADMLLVHQLKEDLQWLDEAIRRLERCQNALTQVAQMKAKFPGEYGN